MPTAKDPAQAQPGKEQPENAHFYRFEDANGRLHIVDSLDLVPHALRGGADRVHYDEQTAVNGLPAATGLTGRQIFAAGVAAALLLVLLFKYLPGTGRFVTRLALMGVVVALLGGAYFGYLRRTTQPSSGALFATPGTLVEDAKGAVEKMNARIRAQQAELKEIEQAK